MGLSKVWPMAAWMVARMEVDLVGQTVRLRVDRMDARWDVHLVVWKVVVLVGHWG